MNEDIPVHPTWLCLPAKRAHEWCTTTGGDLHAPPQCPYRSNATAGSHCVAHGARAIPLVYVPFCTSIEQCAMRRRRSYSPRTDPLHKLAIPLDLLRRLAPHTSARSRNQTWCVTTFPLMLVCDALPVRRYWGVVHELTCGGCAELWPARRPCSLLSCVYSRNCFP